MGKFTNWISCTGPKCRKWSCEFMNYKIRDNDANIASHLIQFYENVHTVFYSLKAAHK